MSSIVVAVAVCSMLLTLLVHACARILLGRHTPPPRALPAVSILKPLKGVDAELRANLASFLAQDYPRFQIVLGVADPSDPARRLAEQLQREHPAIDIRIVAGAEPLGRNPKVTNLASLSRAARHDLWLVSDADVRVEPGYLRAIVAELQQPGVGLVTNLFAGASEQSPGSRLDGLQSGTWIAGGMAAAQVLTGRACVVGKSMLFERDVLERLGGWPAFADVLAEDYVIGCRVEELGLRAATSSHVVHTADGRMDVRRFVARQLRWAQIRRRLSPLAFFAEPLLNPVLWWLLAAAAGAPAAAACAIALKIASDAALARAVRGRGLSVADMAWIPVKDLLCAAIWAVASGRRRVAWRGTTFWIGPGTELLDDRPRPRRSSAAPAAAPIASA